MTSLNLQDFSFPFPPELIAHEPLKDRDSSRLLVRSREGQVQHKYVQNLPDLLPPGTLLIVNDSRVIPSRIYGETSHGGRVEIMLLEPATEPYPISSPDSSVWKAIGRPMRKLKIGAKLKFAAGLEGTIEAVPMASAEDLQPLTIGFPLKVDAFEIWLSEHGFIPLPPYIQRENPLPASLSPDTPRYQTVYAKPQGSVAAPTAGLHLTQILLERLAEREIKTAAVTLHVGGGTFLPVRAQDFTQHRMHEERFLVSSQTLAEWRKAKDEGRPIVTVGTTSLRCMESLLRMARSCDRSPAEFADRWHKTGLFLHPIDRTSKVEVEAASGLMTNFHQPESTLFMLVSALIGLNNSQALYREAVEKKYRLFSYGDSSLLWL